MKVEEVLATWPADVAADAAAVFDAARQDPQLDHGPDNLRVARAGNAAEVAVYREAMLTGCCGQRDVVLVAGSSVELVMVGYDYGH